MHPPPPEQFVADQQFLFEPESDMDDENVVEDTGEEDYDLSGRTIVIWSIYNCVMYLNVN